jgi:hypothetical protein
MPDPRMPPEGNVWPYKPYKPEEWESRFNKEFGYMWGKFY